MSAGGEAIGCSHLDKRFGPVFANRDLSLSVDAGTVHAIVGENGAGKSTLLGALYGLFAPDAGEVRIFGQPVARPSVAEALARGVGMVHQHLLLVPTLSAVENVILGAPPARRGLIDRRRAATETAALAAEVGLDCDLLRPVGELPPSQAQRVELVKALWRGARILLLDEPTALLTPAEVEELFAVLRRLVAAGKTVVFVAHKLDEVLALAERVTVLRQGRLVASLTGAATSAAELATAMVGGAPAPPPVRAHVKRGAEMLRLDRLTVRRGRQARLTDIELTLHRGEVVGIAGVEGNGQSELAAAIVGVLPVAGGQIWLGGRNVTRLSVGRRQRLGLAHIPDDRHGQAMVEAMSIRDNLRLGRAHASLPSAAEVAHLLGELDVRPPDPEARLAALSGGNQQKVVVGRALLDRPAVLVCAQPTRGIDLGAVTRIHRALDEARRGGAALLLISADLDELLLLSDRIAVLCRGRLVGCLDNRLETRGTLRARLGELMLGAAA